MKKEDMMKHSFEEKQDFLPGQFINRGINFLLFFFILTENVSPQIPINGFCKLNYFKIDSGYTNLLTVNFNNDSYSDLLVFSPQRKEAAIFYGGFRGEFKDIKKFSFPSEVNYIQPLNFKSSFEFAFVNRQKRQAGIYEFNHNGKPVLTRNAVFDSYPEFLNTADVNSDGKNELLVSGGAFNSISLLFQEGSKLIEDKVVSEGVFSQAIFIELNNDGYKDIAGYDLVNGTFNFFYNNSRGEYRKARSVSHTEKPNALKTFDINLDNYEDLIFSTENSINIWYGDFRSSYERTKKINTNYKPDKFIYGDFNKDGLMDLAYLNLENSIVSVLFAVNESDFYSEIIYLMQEGLTDVIPYYSRFIDGVAAISITGSIYTITHVSSFTDDVNLSIGANPNALSFFDNGNNSITDFCFIDEFDNKIKFITRDVTGIPAYYFSYQLFEDHSKIISETLGENKKIFICFSYDKKLIEVIQAEFNLNKINKTVLYSPGIIADLKVRREKDEEYKIFVLFKIDSSLNLGIFNCRNLQFDFSAAMIAGNVKAFDASFGLINNLNASYWVETEEKISLYYYDSLNLHKRNKEVYSLTGYGNTKVSSFTGDLLNMEKNITISFVNNDTSDFSVISADSLISVVKKDNKQGKHGITSKNNLFFGETRFNGLKKLCIYSPGQNTISRLEFIRQGKDVAFSNLAEISDAGSFFIKNMTSKDYHIVYSDRGKNCIKIKRLR